MEKNTFISILMYPLNIHFCQKLTFETDESFALFGGKIIFGNVALEIENVYKQKSQFSLVDR